MDINKVLRVIKKAWRWVWHSDSFLSYVVSILIIFLLVKYIVYPGIGLLLGTRMPIVAVMSNSMHHSQGFNEWWNNHSDWYEERGITLDEFKEYSLKNGFNKGDLIIIKGVNPEQLKRGDIIVYMAGTNYPIIHRIVAIHNTTTGLVFETKGDNNKAQIVNVMLNEQNISADQIIGKAIARIPLLGYPKVLLSEIFTTIRDVSTY
ncbi:signal peptidase I [Candidatus Woesearchaeota archaeon]|nr:signal peptidase I [Candidatus Woesearchaeota archaeon]